MPSDQKLVAMADLFLDSANILLNQDKAKFYFVILYMLGTSIELYLKAIITISRKKPPPIHDLTSLTKLANVDAPNFLQTLTHYLCWKSKYHEAIRQKYEEEFNNENNVAVNYDEILDYIEALKNNYLKC